MEFGIFDHLDRNTLPLQEFYEGRLKLAEALDRAGFYAYHIAEHHSTPLGMAPSPTVFLAAMAERTRRLRFGPLVYCLPFYHPLRLLEEICMLDQLSGGRLEVGVGRGISPFESGYYGVDYNQARKVFDETLEIITKGMISKSLTFDGEYYHFHDVPVELEPVQTPHPPFWYGVHTVESADSNARRGFNIVSGDPVATVRQLTDRYRAVWKETGRNPNYLPKMGLTRFVVVAEDDETALNIGRRAYPKWHASFSHLYHTHGRSPMLGERPSDFEGIRKNGIGIAGSPKTVAAILREQLAESGVNYLVSHFIFGDVTLNEALRTVDLFKREVIPALD